MPSLYPLLEGWLIHCPLVNHGRNHSGVQPQTSVGFSCWRLWPTSHPRLLFTFLSSSPQPYCAGWVHAILYLWISSNTHCFLRKITREGFESLQIQKTPCPLGTCSVIYSVIGPKWMDGWVSGWVGKWVNRSWKTERQIIDGWTNGLIDNK